MKVKQEDLVRGELASLYRGLEKHRRSRHPTHCLLGVGCEQAGVCYAAAQGSPQECGAVYADA